MLAKLTASRTRIVRILSSLSIISIVLLLTACLGGGGGGGGSTPGTLQLSAASYSAAEGIATVTVTVTRTGGSSGAASVDYATTDGTATSASDYTAAGGTLNWADGDSASKSVNITITDDTDVDPGESFTIALSNATTATLGTTTLAAVDITDNEVPGALSLSAASYNAAEGTATVTITVSRSGGSDGAVSVDYATADGTATSAGDYTAATGTLNWAVGDATDKTFNIAITDDANVELAEAFSVSLSNASVASLGTTTSATVDITDNDSTTITGVVSAPGSVVAFNGPSLTDRVMAFLFGEPARATIGDFASAVGAGVTVNVYEINADGTLTTGVPITTATTDASGAYVLAAPLDAPASKYIIRAEGSTGTMESRITAATVDVDPVTDATSLLVVYAASDLTTISTDEIGIIQGEVSDLVEEVDAASQPTATALSSTLEAAAKADEEIDNVVTSTVASGSICGTVTKASGVTPLQNVLILVKDYGNWVIRAKAKTAADGTYCVNVPTGGNYIVAAINRTNITVDPDRSASEWYNASGGGVFPVNADKVSVPNTTPVTVNFDLAPGIRIHGTVTDAATGLVSMEGVQVLIRDVDTNFPVASARVNASGTYGVNVMPGTYTVMVRNFTTKPYASQYSTSVANAANNHNLFYAKIYDSTGLTPGTSGQTADFALDAGNLLTGTITEATNPVTGTLVLVDDPTLGGANVRLRTNKNGEFHLWLKPNIYDVLAYGQTDLGIDMTAGDYAVSFTADVAKQPLLVRDSALNPVSQAKVLLYDSTGKYLGRQVTSSDGTTTVYSASAAGNHSIEVRIDDPELHGSIIYNGQTQLANATAVALDPAVTTPLTSFNVDLPDAGVLKVVVQDDSTNKTPQPNIAAQVRDGGAAPTNKFVANRTHGNGVTYLSLPGNAGSSRIYNAVHVNQASGANCPSVPIQNGLTTTITFYTGTNACTVGSPL